MTIAVTIKVRDGIVLAADSATTLVGASGAVSNIYNHAHKIANLKKGSPIGFMTWGLGSMGPSSIVSLAKDFRSDWAAHFKGTKNPNIKRVATEVSAFLGQKYSTAMAGLPVAQPFGCLVAGYNVRDELPECWLIEADTTNATLSAPISLIPDETGIYWAGQPRWISRLLLGIDQDGVASALKNAFQVADDKILAALDAIKSYTEVPMVHPAMPLQDAIDLGRFLVQMTATSVRFSPGEQTVGGPVEIAAITRHEGFRWIDRKLYFDARLNGETMR